MIIETKYDMGQEVFYLNKRDECLEKRRIMGIKTEVWYLNGIPEVSTIYRLDNHSWCYDGLLYTDEGIASEELLETMKDKVKQAILTILQNKQRNGDVLPYATSIEVAHLLKMNVLEVEKIAQGIDGIVRGRTLNHEYYYE